ncbi:MAG: hypothetical protein HYV09_33255 [Deltaproteobacteria bacterium]|nr:hypothetical protein [Deltaproteobacteria bacterium]
MGGRPIGRAAHVLLMGALALAPAGARVPPPAGTLVHTLEPFLGDPSPFGPGAWTWSRTFEHPTHLSAIRARFASTTHGVPTRYRWETSGCGDETWRPLADTGEPHEAATGVVLPRRRTWFVDTPTRVCALRLVVTATNGGRPAIERVEAIEGARNVLRDAIGGMSADGGDPVALVDGTYERAWVGAPGRSTWSIEVRLPRPERIDRVRLVLGADATSVASVARGGTHGYAVTRAPRRLVLSVSEDGVAFTTIARSDAPVRRPLIRVPGARPIVALRLALEGATDDVGHASPIATPMVRELAAYAADDPAPVLPEPWILSVNANPASSFGPRGSTANDVYFAKFLQMRFASLLPSMARDDRYARALGPVGELIDTPRSPSDGRALESIAGDDPLLRADWLRASWPPPIVVLSGSNDWEYARRTSIAPKGRTRWNPLLPAKLGGMGDVADAIQSRAAPFLGFCGGAQLIALLEARRDGSGDEIDAVLRRNNGRLIRGFAPASSLIRAWPGEAHLSPRVTFDPRDALFADLAGPSLRNTTQAFPQSHLDLIRPEAFDERGPLARFEVLATSLFCSSTVVASLHPVAATKNPNGAGRCARVTEVFRARPGEGWPIVGAQFHAEQRDFSTPPPGDPPEAVADARLFVAGAYEEVIDAYLRLAGAP